MLTNKRLLVDSKCVSSFTIANNKTALSKYLFSPFEQILQVPLTQSNESIFTFLPFFSSVVSQRFYAIK